MKTVKVSTKPLSITLREKECLILSDCGQNENQISKVLKISSHTVRIQIQNSKNRLGANNKTHAVIRAFIKRYISLKEIQNAQVKYIKRRLSETSCLLSFRFLSPDSGSTIEQPAD